MKQSVLLAAFEPVLGLPTWNAKKGVGSFLTFEFGKPSLVIREPKLASSNVSDRVAKQLQRRAIHVTGEWHLWIYCCNWRIFSAEQELACNESSDDEIKNAIETLDGQILNDVNVKPADGISEFHFDLGGKIATWPNSLSEEQWMLYGRSPDRVLTYRGDGCYSDDFSNKPDAEIDWHPLY